MRSILIVFVFLSILFTHCTSSNDSDKFWYYEYQSQVKDTLFMKSGNDFYPLPNYYTLLYRCYTWNDVTMFYTYLKIRNMENNSTENLLIQQSPNDSANYYFAPKKVFKKGDTFFTTYDCSHAKNAASSLFDNTNKDLPDEIVFPPYACLISGKSEFNTPMIQAKLLKYEQQVLTNELKQKFLQIRNEFEAIDLNQIQLEESVTGRTASSYRKLIRK